MYWKLKSCMQNFISLLPTQVSYEVYYFMQKKIGSLKNVSPEKPFTGAVEIAEKLKKQHFNCKEKIFFELGTGRDLTMPLVLYLLGAKKIITVDINPYAKVELIQNNINHICRNVELYKKLLQEFIDEDRLNRMLYFANHYPRFDLNSFFDFFSIEYRAPCDARSTGLDDALIDCYISNNVLEHIETGSIAEILKESARIIRKNGLSIHTIDYSDHFSHNDSTISTINFLQYSDRQWRWYAGNRFMYANRLLHDDFVNLFRKLGLYITQMHKHCDANQLARFRSQGLKLNKKFSSKSDDILAITSCCFVLRSGQPVKL